MMSEAQTIIFLETKASLQREIIERQDQTIAAQKASIESLERMLKNLQDAVEKYKS
jgi:uncharacterized coiled-coil protein SlyX